MNAPILECRNLEVCYPVGGGIFRPGRRLRAVRGVSLALQAGTSLALVGESGCGKSSIAKALLGLERPSGGEILFAGRDIAGYAPLERSRLIQGIFQDPSSSLNPRRSIGRILSLPLEIHGLLTAGERRDAVAEMLVKVGLSPSQKAAYPSELSGGQRQRVAIGRALMLRPKVVICDEPTSALDVSVQSQIMNLLLDLQRDFGLSYLFISHNLPVVHHMASTIAVMYLGRIVELIPTEDIFGAAQHPYTQALSGSVLRAAPSDRIRDSAVNLEVPSALDPPPGCAFHPRCPRVMDICRSRQPEWSPSTTGGVRCHLFAPLPTGSDLEVSSHDR